MKLIPLTRRTKLTLFTLSLVGTNALLNMAQAENLTRPNNTTTTMEQSSNTIRHQHNHRGVHNKMMSIKFRHLAKILSLSSKQKKQIKHIFKQAKNQQLSYQPMMNTFHQAMQTLLTAPTFNEEAILNLKANYKNIFDKLAMIKAKSRYNLYALLTLEQKHKWLTLQARQQSHD